MGCRRGQGPCSSACGGHGEFVLPFLYIMRALPLGERPMGWICDLFWAMVGGDFGHPASQDKRKWPLFLVAGWPMSNGHPVTRKSQSQEVAEGSGVLLGKSKGFLLESSRGASVFCHPQVVEDRTDIACELSHSLWDTADPFGFDEADGETSESGDVFWPIAGAYTAAVFIKVPIQYIVAAVLDSPMAAVNGKELLGIGFIGFSAGDTEGDIVGGFSCLFFDRFPFDHEGLSHMGEVEIGIELGGGPDFTGFDPTMIRGIKGDEIRFFAVLEIELDILQESGLIAFDREVVMGVTLQV